MLTAETFLAEIEQFLKAASLSATALGRAAIGDPNFVSDLRAGRSPSLQTVGRVQRYMSENRPRKRLQRRPTDEGAAA